MTLTVFVTDGESKAALGITRSLGQKGIKVIVGSHLPIGRALLSKYCSRRERYPDLHKASYAIFWFDRFLIENEIDVLIPVSYMACRFFSKYREFFEKYTKIPTADWGDMRIASNKLLSNRIAKFLGVPVPKATRCMFNLSYPHVIKSDEESDFFAYINNICDEMASVKKHRTHYEYIPGQGYGYTALCDHGKVVLDFQHMRVREYPITGGAATFAKCVHYQEMEEYGRKILEALNWHGVAMVEFKKDERDGKFKMIEVNPKFWGSLDLPLSWGVDFPYYLVLLALGELPDKITLRMCEAKMFRWIFPQDILALLAEPGKALAWFDELFLYRSCRFSLDRSDWVPELFNILMTPYAIVKAMRTGLRYPNGRPVAKEGKL